MPKRIYEPYKHPDERIVDALVEEFEADVELLVDFWSINGRPAFTHKLTEDEMILRFANPTTRQEIIASLEERGGGTAVVRYMEQMTRLMRRFIYKSDLT